MTSRVLNCDRGPTLANGGFDTFFFSLVWLASRRAREKRWEGGGGRRREKEGGRRNEKGGSGYKERETGKNTHTTTTDRREHRDTHTRVQDVRRGRSRRSSWQKEKEGERGGEGEEREQTA